MWPLPKWPQVLWGFVTDSRPGWPAPASHNDSHSWWWMCFLPASHPAYIWLSLDCNKLGLLQSPDVYQPQSCRGMLQIHFKATGWGISLACTARPLQQWSKRGWLSLMRLHRCASRSSIYTAAHGTFDAYKHIEAPPDPVKICVSSADRTAFIKGWAETKRLSPLSSALFTRIVRPNKNRSVSTSFQNRGSL